MNYSTSKAEFIQKCFQEKLDDGQPHRYREILEYIRQRAVGTEFEGGIEENNTVIAFGKYLSDPDASYARIRHGVYQKIPIPQMQYRQVNRQLTSLYHFLDQAVALQEQMAEVYNEGCANCPDSRERFGGIWKSANQKVDELIDGLSVWLAETEDYGTPVQDEQQSPQEMQM